MELYINTTKNNSKTIELKLKKGNKLLGTKYINSDYDQAEKLLIAIKNFLKESSLDLKEIKKIYVKNTGKGFTSLRIGVITANALGYALGCNMKATNKKSIKDYKNYKIVKPQYNKEPNIG